MDALIYIANCLYLGAYFVRDMLKLRLLSLAAASCLVGYFATRTEVLVPVIAWNLAFVSLNAIQVARLIRCTSADCNGTAGDSKHTDTIPEQADIA